ncbi:Ionotropic receptor 21a [Lucilia cuprina]|nr:Ionotropic receptor 21a [Lucilia cuprina]
MTKLTEIVLDSVEPTVNLSLILAALWIINNDFAKYTISAVTIGQYAINQRNRLYHNDLINDIIKRAMISPGIKLYTEGELQEKAWEKEDNVNDYAFKNPYVKANVHREKSIWFLDSFTSYKNFERLLVDPMGEYHRNGFFLLIYTGTEHERLSHVKEIFRRLFNLYCTNVNVLMVVGKFPYLYTYFPFAKNKCHSSMPEFYISFRDIEKNFSGFQVKKNIFPSKVDNMFGCELSVATWQYPPYIYVDRDPISGKFLRLHGIEGSLLSLLGELMNFKIRLNVPDPPDRGDVFPNGTATGATKMIIEAQANITIISLMYNKIRADTMQASKGYLFVPYVMAIPQGRKMTSFERLMKPFRYIIWSCFSSSIIFGILFIYFIRYLGRSKLMDFIYGKGNRIPFTNLLAVLFGISIHGALPHKNFARYILMIFLLYTFVLRSAYSGALYILLQDGRARNTFKTINEIVDNNFTIYAFPAVEKVLKMSIPGANTAIVDANNPTSKLYKRISSSSSENVALCLLDYSIRSYNQMNPNQRVEILEQTVLTTPIVFYMPRHTYIRFRTDELILRILSAGIIGRFESYYLFYSRQSQPKIKEPVKLSFQLLFALFCIYGVLLLFSFVIFLMELLSLKSDWCKIIVDFLNI